LSAAFELLEPEISLEAASELLLIAIKPITTEQMQRFPRQPKNGGERLSEPLKALQRRETAGRVGRVTSCLAFLPDMEEEGDRR